MAGKHSDFHMEWTDVRKTSSTPMFDFKGRVLSDPSGGLAAQWNLHIPDSAVPFHSDGTLFSAASFFPLNGVVAKGHGLNVCLLHSRYWKVLMLQLANKMLCFMRACWILQAISAAPNKTAHHVSAPSQGQLYWCNLPCVPFFKIRIYSMSLE